ncbi:ATP-binding protein, partial [Klebsiella pneumoniae]|uniref:ATP-binding protein n=1 Tax=Klebsiella pneumoniae TaxID=573 RepID=UPI00209A8DE2
SETMQEFNNMFDRLEGAFRKLSDFSSDIAHELRTPVSNLMMQTQFALAKERDVSHYREILFANLEELKSPANLERLFDRFYRADSSRFYNTEGAGLGLSITRSIIHAHGGELSAEQQGREIVFSVRLLMD